MTLQAARSAGKEVVYGQNRQLEKEYLRLTSMPTLDAVRPPAILKKALRHVQQRWLQVSPSAPVFSEVHRGCTPCDRGPGPLALQPVIMRYALVGHPKLALGFGGSEGNGNGAIVQ